MDLRLDLMRQVLLETQDLLEDDHGYGLCGEDFWILAFVNDAGYDAVSGIDGKTRVCHEPPCGVFFLF